MLKALLARLRRRRRKTYSLPFLGALSDLSGWAILSALALGFALAWVWYLLLNVAVWNEGTYERWSKVPSDALGRAVHGALIT